MGKRLLGRFPLPASHPLFSFLSAAAQTLSVCAVTLGSGPVLSAYSFPPCSRRRVGPVLLRVVSLPNSFSTSYAGGWRNGTAKLRPIQERRAPLTPRRLFLPPPPKKIEINPWSSHQRAIHNPGATDLRSPRPPPGLFGSGVISASGVYGCLGRWISIKPRCASLSAVLPIPSPRRVNIVTESHRCLRVKTLPPQAILVGAVAASSIGVWGALPGPQEAAHSHIGSRWWCWSLGLLVGGKRSRGGTPSWRLAQSIGGGCSSRDRLGSRAPLSDTGIVLGGLKSSPLSLPRPRVALPFIPASVTSHPRPLLHRGRVDLRSQTR
jgi:hypothetical protein